MRAIDDGGWLVVWFGLVLCGVGGRMRWQNEERSAMTLEPYIKVRVRIRAIARDMTGAKQP